MPTGIFHCTDIKDFGSGGRKFQHLLACDPVDLAGSRHDPGIRGENTIDIRVDLTHVSVEGGSERDSGGV